MQLTVHPWNEFRKTGMACISIPKSICICKQLDLDKQGHTGFVKSKIHDLLVFKHGLLLLTCGVIVVNTITKKKAEHCG